MPELDLDELERLAKLAEPLPWREDVYMTDHGNSVSAVYNIDGDMIVHTDESLLAEVFNCEYIVAACNAVPELIAENRALRERVRELERQKRVLVEKMAIDILCSECPVSEACPYENATFIDLEDCAKQLEKWSENAAKEAGE